MLYKLTIPLTVIKIYNTICDSIMLNKIAMSLTMLYKLTILLAILLTKLLTIIEDHIQLLPY